MVKLEVQSLCSFSYFYEITLGLNIQNKVQKSMLNSGNTVQKQCIQNSSNEKIEDKQHQKGQEYSEVEKDKQLGTENSLSKKYFKSPDKDCLSNWSISPRNLCIYSDNGPKQKIYRKNWQTEEQSNHELDLPDQVRTNDKKFVPSKRDTIFEELTSRIIQLTRQNQTCQLRQLSLQNQIQQLRSRYQRQSNRESENMKQLEFILKQTQKIQQQMNELKLENERLTALLEKSLQKQHLLANVLDQSEEINYTLRLKIQQLSQQLLKRPEVGVELQQWSQQKDKMILQLEQKINKLQIMKKQYLRAYSRVKEQKQQLQLQILSMKQQNLTLKQNVGSIDSIRLKTIVEMPQEQFRESMSRITRLSQAYPTAHVKMLLERALMKSNKQQSDESIIAALHFLNSHQIQSHQIQQMHSYYKNLLEEIEKSSDRERKKYQTEFNQLFNKLISQKCLSPNKIDKIQVEDPIIQNITTIQIGINTENQNLQNKKQQTEKNHNPKQQYNHNSKVKIHKSKSFDQINWLNSQLQNDSKKQQNSKNRQQNYEFASKLLVLHERYQKLQQKYDKLKKRNQNLQKMHQFDLKNHQNFEQFMEKLIRSQIKLQNSGKTEASPNTQIQSTNQLLSQIYKLTFESLCNFPTGQHGTILFAPENLSELLESITTLYNFSLKYTTENNMKNQAYQYTVLELLKILQNIFQDSKTSEIQFKNIVKQSNFVMMHDKILYSLQKISKKILLSSIQQNGDLNRKERLYTFTEQNDYRRSESSLLNESLLLDNDQQQEKVKQISPVRMSKKVSKTTSPVSIQQRNSKKLSDYVNTPEFQAEIQRLRKRMRI